MSTSTVLNNCQLVWKRKQKKLPQGREAMVWLNSVTSYQLTKNSLKLQATLEASLIAPLVKNLSAVSAGDLGSIPRLGRSPGEAKGYPLHYPGLENSMDCIVYGVSKSHTQLNNFHFSLYPDRCVPSLSTETSYLSITLWSQELSEVCRTTAWWRRRGLVCGLKVLDSCPSSVTNFLASWICFLFVLCFIFMYLAELSLHCCVQAFSSCSPWAPHCGGFSHHGAWALGCLGFSCSTAYGTFLG